MTSIAAGLTPFVRAMIVPLDFSHVGDVGAHPHRDRRSVNSDRCSGQGGRRCRVGDSSADPCEPYAVDVKIVHEPECGTAEKETYLFLDFRMRNRVSTLETHALLPAGSAIIRTPRSHGVMTSLARESVYEYCRYRPETLPTEEVLVLPRGDQRLVFRACGVPDMEAFVKLCPGPDARKVDRQGFCSRQG